MYKSETEKGDEGREGGREGRREGKGWKRELHCRWNKGERRKRRKEGWREFSLVR